MMPAEQAASRDALIGALIQAAKNLSTSGVLHASTDGADPQHALLLSPAVALRQAAERMEREDAAIFAFRRAVAPFFEKEPVDAA